jgi:hypothetical protein
MDRKELILTSILAITPVGWQPMPTPPPFNRMKTGATNAQDSSGGIFKWLSDRELSTRLPQWMSNVSSEGTAVSLSKSGTS